MSTTTAEAPAASRFAGLDTLRGFAVARIVLFHYTTNYHYLFGRHGTPTVDLHHTDFSVPMFFVVSGFVIPLTLQKCTSLRDFAFLRVSRLYPTFLVCIAMTFAAVATFGLPGREVSTGEAVVNLTMIPRVLGAGFIEPACWTLQVELTFYALMGALLVAGLLRVAPVVFLGMALVHAMAVRFGWQELEAMLLLQYAHLFAIGLLLFEMRYHRRPWHFVAFAAVWVVAYVDRGPAYLVWIAVFFALTALSVFR
ncbi:MAG TPA: acyltransferase, partial [Polyangiaceae bacterium]